MTSNTPKDELDEILKEFYKEDWIEGADKAKQAIEAYVAQRIVDELKPIVELGEAGYIEAKDRMKQLTKNVGGEE